MADIPSTRGYEWPGELSPLPVLYAQTEQGLRDATESEILRCSHALLQRRFRCGAPVGSYPELIRSLLQTKMGLQECSVFFAIFLDERGGLIQVAEMFRGTTRQVNIHPREIAAAALACRAEGVICARTDAGGSSTVTRDDIEAARWLWKMFQVMDVQMGDYIVVGDRLLSLRQMGKLPPKG
jgi:DNA repair protein RadC